ncbi:unnamed protein product [Moneuplotes crassus]|uniref:Uncharacterized protein n=1 Tax=Euplotes crassus TaxID=5936 RepID=A0AAD1X7P0_EUPCR|nr:unnamed protein product [Moneuplotes crassus]
MYSGSVYKKFVNRISSEKPKLKLKRKFNTSASGEASTIKFCNKTNKAFPKKLMVTREDFRSGNIENSGSQSPEKRMKAATIRVNKGITTWEQFNKGKNDSRESSKVSTMREGKSLTSKFSEEASKDQFFKNSRAKIAKSAKKGTRTESQSVYTNFKGLYTEKPAWRLRVDDPTKQIHKDRIRMKVRTENQRIREEIGKHHPIMREGFDIEGYYHYCWRPEDPSKFVVKKNMNFELNDLKRSIAESTYKKGHSKNFSVSQMLEESKSTLRVTEPYIGGEKETGLRIHRQRDKSRELSHQQFHRSSKTKYAKKESLISKKIYHRANLSNSIDTSSLMGTSTIKILDNSRFDTFENKISKNCSLNVKTRPVSAYTHVNMTKKTRIMSGSSKMKNTGTRPSTSAKGSFQQKIKLNEKESNSFRRGHQSPKEGSRVLETLPMDKINSSVLDTEDEFNLMDEAEEQPRPKTRENWFKEDNKSFSRISEEETVTDKNSYGLRLKPKCIRKRLIRKALKHDVKKLISSYF